MTFGELGLHSPLLFAVAVLVLNATPGVDLVLVLTRTLQHGVRAGLAAALGICAGSVLHALAAAFGLAALLAASAAAFTAVKWVGAAYLLWLAMGMAREATRPSSGDGTAPTGAERRDVPPAMAFRQGLLTNVLNPKVALFFLALLPQFIAADAAHKTLAFLMLGGWFVLQSLAFLMLFVLLTAPLARWRPGPRVRRSLHGAGALLFAGLAARLAVAER